MPDDLIATGFEADAGFQRIEIAVERVTQGDGDTHRQDAGGLVSFGTSLGHDRPPYRQGENGGEMGALNRGVYTKDIFCKQKTGNELNLLGLGQPSAARALRRVISRVWREDAQSSGCEAEVMRLLGGTVSSERVWGQGN
jgi:hypothetical protein